MWQPLQSTGLAPCISAWKSPSHLEWVRCSNHLLFNGFSWGKYSQSVKLTFKGRCLVVELHSSPRSLWELAWQCNPNTAVLLDSNIQYLTWFLPTCENNWRQSMVLDHERSNGSYSVTDSCGMRPIEAEYQHQLHYYTQMLRQGTKLH
jgi:hypothetical protein